MKSFFLVALMALVGFVTYAQDYPADYAQAPRFKVLFYHSEEVEEAHRQFAQQALNFFWKLSWGEGFLYEVTTDLSKYSDEQLKSFDLQVWLNNSPQNRSGRRSRCWLMQIIRNMR